MKTIVSLFACAALSFNGYAQLLNPDFEIVNDQGNATNWKPLTFIVLPIDSSCVGQGMDSLFFTTNEAYSGQRALEIRTGSYCGSVYSNIVSATKSDSDTTFYSQSVPFTERPNSISFYYKLHTLHGDAGQFSIQLDGADGTRIADAAYTLPDETTAWTKVTVPLQYYEVEHPAFLNLHFGIRNDTVLHYGSRFLIDKITFGTATGVDELIRSKAGLICYPVPAKDQLNICLNNHAGLSSASVIITDATGRIMSHISMSGIKNGEIKVDIKNLSGGMYFVQVVGDGLLMNGKFVK